MTYPSNSDDLPIRKLYDRWERFEDSRREMSDDLKELFAEGKASGHNPKAMRIAFAERYRQTHDDADKRAKRELQDEEVELYLAALAGVPARAREIIEEFPPVPPFVAISSSGNEVSYDAETGEVIEAGNPVSDSSTAARKDVREGSGGETAGREMAAQPDLVHAPQAGTQAPPVDTNLPAAVEGSGSTGGADVGDGGETDAREGAPYINPDCAKPDTCQFASKTYLCSVCNSARAERLVAQRRGKA